MSRTNPSLEEEAEALIGLRQYSLPQAEKERRLREALRRVHEHHLERSDEYRRIVTALFPAYVDACRWGPGLSDVPFLPVGLFKSRRLTSIPDDAVFKTLTSSGTTGEVSRIVLDRASAARQTAALASVMTTLLGRERLPMLICDHPGVIGDRGEFSARGAGILGMMTFGRAHRYLLDAEMQLDEAGLADFLERYGSAPFLVFGFTFMIWRHLLGTIAGRGFDLSNAILVHSGGWKKLQEEAVGNAEFKAALLAETGIHQVHSFYGMVEQIGTVFLEGTEGLMYSPTFSDVVIRDPDTWQEAASGTVGVIQVLSALPTSYPGHSLLTEDLGIVRGIDDGPGGWLGKRFEVIGRVPRAELRGCSDTQAAAEAAAGNAVPAAASGPTR